ncbi:MAG: T9SS type A sorting domain-containing protein [Porphyromonadaceae bacterium]|nr:T9SS type A sorting domain-containing protein [Porphyromonadaceae bacterium]
MLIESFGWKSGVNSKISVAENGWIYLMTYTSNQYATSEGNNGFLKILVSYDEGKKYDLLIQWDYVHVTEKLVDADLVITGKDANDIRIWIITAKRKTPTGTISVRLASFDSKGDRITQKVQEITEGKDIDVYSVAVATDYRSPGKDSEPYTVAAAYTCQYTNSSMLPFVKHNYVGYFYTLNGDGSIEHKFVYDGSKDEKITDVDISLGTSMFIPEGRVAIAALKEKGFTKEVILLMDRYHFPSATVPLDKPIATLGIGKNLTNPKVQMICDNALDTKNTHAFAITATEPDKPIVTYLWYPKAEFDLDNPYDKDNIGEISIPGISELSLAYDKKAHNFLFTYYNNKPNRLEYTVTNWSNLSDWEKYIQIGYYHIPGSKAINTSLDINPTKTQAGFTWTEVSVGSPLEINYYSILADYEWATTTDIDNTQADKQGLIVVSNPAEGEISLRVNRADNYTAALYDLQGKLAKTFSFNGSNHTFSVQDLTTGVYLLKLVSGNGSYQTKLMVD